MTHCGLLRDIGLGVLIVIVVYLFLVVFIAKRYEHHSLHVDMETNKHCHLFNQFRIFQ